MTGDIINYRYEVLDKIGEGTLFTVYRSRDKVHNKLVSLKVLKPPVAEYREFASAVCTSYKDLSALSHPNIARVIDTDCGEQNAYVATEFVRGINLKERVKRAGSLDCNHVIDIMVPVLEALHFAHSNKIVHGDIRPQDIIVSPDGEVKLTDFGLANALQKFPNIAERLAMRSVHYQAPEVCEGALPTPQSDVYSIGAIMYELLTGRLPFDGATAMSVAMKKLKEAPADTASINQNIPQAINALVMHALATSPENRFSNAAAMLSELVNIRNALRAPAAEPVQTKAVEEPEAEAEYVEQEKSQKLQIVWLTLLFLMGFGVFLGITMYLKGDSMNMKVPNFVGMTFDEALSKAQELGIELKDDGKRAKSDLYPAGAISSQSPSAEEMLPKDKIVTVTISEGPSRIDVPDLTGQSLSEAQQNAANAGFSLGKVTQEYSDTVPADCVIKQDPSGGLRRQAGSAINVVISLGPNLEPTDMPTAEPTPEPEQEVRGAKQKFDIDLEVPESAESAEEVKIVINDNRGETTVYVGTHQPGDKFRKQVQTVGAQPRIRVYIGGKVVSDDTY